MSEKQKKNRPAKKRKKVVPKTAFKPGVSGNPNGRPPKVKCIPDILNKIAEEAGGAAADGVTKYSKLEVIMRKVFEFALAGRPWAVQFIAERTEGKAVEHVETTTDMNVSFGGRQDETEE